MCRWHGAARMAPPAAEAAPPGRGSRTGSNARVAATTPPSRHDVRLPLDATLARAHVSAVQSAIPPRLSDPSRPPSRRPQKGIPRELGNLSTSSPPIVVNGVIVVGNVHEQGYYQTVHHDIWNFDNPTAPVLLDVVVDGRPTPIAVQTTKQGFAYTLNRETGQPVWPIPERPVAASDLPGETLALTQPHPTRPKPLEIQELTEDVLIDFTPELRAEAIEIRKRYKTGPLFTPPIQVGHPSGLRSFVSCPAGASNINGPTTADPEAGVLYVATQRLCRAENLVPGEQMDEPDNPKTTGKTLSRRVVANRGDLRGPDGLPIWKPPYSRIIAIDMHTGEFLWETPNGDTPRHIREHPRLQGLDLPSTGQMVHGVTMPTRTLLLTAPGGDPVLYALDKRTGQRLGTVRLPAPGQYGMMGYLQEGRQYVVVQVASGSLPGSLVALRLPAPARGDAHGGPVVTSTTLT